MSSRRHLFALLAVAVLGVTVSFVVPLDHGAAATAADPGAAVVVASHVSQPAALTARITAGAEQVAADSLRSRRLTGLTLVALLVLVTLQLRPVGSRLRRGIEAVSRTITCTRLVPPRAPPHLLRTAS